MAKVWEKELNKLFVNVIKTSPLFKAWFLSETDFIGREAKVVLARDDNPWHKSKITGKESETDILLVFEDKSKRFAIHIENKTAGDKFRDGQPEEYHARASEWRNTKKYENYDEFRVVLIAPRRFIDANKEKVGIFHHSVAHEDIAAYIPDFEPSYSIEAGGSGRK